MNLIVPYVREDNSCTLPYYIKKDENNYDILVIGEKEIPLNICNSDINYQTTIYNKCFDDYQYKTYQVTNNVYVLYRYLENNYITTGYISVLVNNNEYYLCDFENNDREIYDIIFNNKYIVVYKSDSEYYSREISEGFDIEHEKLIDCTDSKNYKGLLDNVVNKKRCRFDTLISILKGKISEINKERVFDVLSFLVGYEVNVKNYNDILFISQQYILNNYPELLSIDLNLTDEEIRLQTINYGLSYFKFNPINHTIQDIKYKQNKVKVKTR